MSLQSKYANLEAAVRWQSRDALHTERLFFENVNLWRDTFPGDMAEQLGRTRVGEAVQQPFGPEDFVGDADPALVKTIGRWFFTPPQHLPQLRPHAGRFYPRHYMKNGTEFFSEDRRPCRCLRVEDNTLEVDFNVPSQGISGVLESRLVEMLDNKAEHGGRSTDILYELLQNGPGMQALGARGETDFFAGDAFQRMDPRDDSRFYAEPRLVHHLDTTASAQVRALYARFTAPGMRVLDLMSSHISHLPDDMALAVTGLGMNPQELQANPRLAAHWVHDLNHDPVLPLQTAEFDLVVCTASVEYLVHPLAVVRDIARVLKPGGKLIFTFSDRWFPSKAIALWSELHPFERMGLVLAYLRSSGAFEALATESIQGYPHRSGDPRQKERPFADPLYAVWAARK